jgi:hypothetical protein
MKSFDVYKKIIRVINHPDNKPQHFEAINNMIELFLKTKFEDSDVWFRNFDLYCELKAYCNKQRLLIDKQFKVCQDEYH